MREKLDRHKDQQKQVNDRRGFNLLFNPFAAVYGSLRSFTQNGSLMCLFGTTRPQTSFIGALQVIAAAEQTAKRARREKHHELKREREAYSDVGIVCSVSRYTRRLTPLCF